MPIATVSVSETPPAANPTSMDLSNRIATIKQDTVSSSNASPTETIKDFSGKIESLPSKETTLTNTDVLPSDPNNYKQNHTVMANGTTSSTHTNNNSTTKSNEQNHFQDSFANHNKAKATSTQTPKVKVNEEQSDSVCPLNGIKETPSRTTATTSTTANNKNDQLIPPPTRQRTSTTTSQYSSSTPNTPQSHQSKNSAGRLSTVTNTTVASSGMDRRGYDEAHTITIPNAYRPTVENGGLGITSGSDKYLHGHQAQARHRFTRNGSFDIRNQRRRSKMKADDRYVIPGQRVVEGHQNYIMAYNMITGIRVAVSRCSWLPSPVKEEDFSNVTKLIFDMEGNSLTPGTKYEFKFKDYAPEVFRRLRTRFGIDQADYLLSLTEKVSLNELGSPGKSGSFFYYSRDYKFIIKTIHHSEHRQLRKVLKQYYEYVEKNPNTFISQFYGLHRLKMYTRKGIIKVHFIVMNNLFPPHRAMNLTYDLKGSTHGRRTDIEKAKAAGKTSIIAKDLNFLELKDKISLGPIKKKPIIEQIAKDVKLLQQLNIMDYSLLIGVHDLRKSQEEDPDNLMANFDPPPIHPHSHPPLSPPNELETEIPEPTQGEQNQDQDPSSNPPQNTTPTPTSKHPHPHPHAQHQPKQQVQLQQTQQTTTSTTTTNPCFIEPDGGIRATDANNQDQPLVYYMGIIDSLTNYSTFKRCETLLRCLKDKRETISAIPAYDYGERFYKFMDKIIVSKTQEELNRTKY
ncbi:unnamed protein product [Ambrosiozyma monospora]|uniref:Unnamed protein product n=1 Tax=Ambrosiozyma monospora TaxID=43982 RepID=A0ACB5SU65_AMBMO|nr:unnamed protein product [Ambrosiozyma monospora]